MFIAESNQFIKKGLYFGSDIMDSGTQIQFDINGNLIVSGSAAMDFFSCITYFFGERRFHLRMYVFRPFFYSEIAILNVRFNFFETMEYHCKIIFTEKPDTLQHFYMSN